MRMIRSLYKGDAQTPGAERKWSESHMSRAAASRRGFAAHALMQLIIDTTRNVRIGRKRAEEERRQRDEQHQGCDVAFSAMQQAASHCTTCGAARELCCHTGQVCLTSPAKPDGLLGGPTGGLAVLTAVRRLRGEAAAQGAAGRSAVELSTAESQQMEVQPQSASPLSSTAAAAADGLPVCVFTVVWHLLWDEHPWEKKGPIELSLDGHAPTVEEALTLLSHVVPGMHTARSRVLDGGGQILGLDGMGRALQLGEHLICHCRGDHPSLFGGAKAWMARMASAALHRVIALGGGRAPRSGSRLHVLLGEWGNGMSAADDSLYTQCTNIMGYQEDQEAADDAGVAHKYACLAGGCLHKGDVSCLAQVTRGGADTCCIDREVVDCWGELLNEQFPHFYVAPTYWATVLALGDCARFVPGWVGLFGRAGRSLKTLDVLCIPFLVAGHWTFYVFSRSCSGTGAALAFGATHVCTPGQEAIRGQELELRSRLVELLQALATPVRRSAATPDVVVDWHDAAVVGRADTADTGLHVAMHTLALARGVCSLQDPAFEQADMPYIRRVVAVILIRRVPLRGRTFRLRLTFVDDDVQHECVVSPERPVTLAAAIGQVLPGGLDEAACKAAYVATVRGGYICSLTSAISQDDFGEWHGLGALGYVDTTGEEASCLEVDVFRRTKGPMVPSSQEDDGAPGDSQGRAQEQESESQSAGRIPNNAQRSLCPADEREVERLLALTGDPHEPLCSHTNELVTRYDMRTLRPGAWLNGEVINFYIAMLSAAHPDIYFTRTYFYTKLLQGGEYKYRNVSSWTRRLDVFSRVKPAPERGGVGNRCHATPDPTHTHAPLAASNHGANSSAQQSLDSGRPGARWAQQRRHQLHRRGKLQ